MKEGDKELNEKNQCKVRFSESRLHDVQEKLESKP